MSTNRAFVTGAAGDIGSATARVLASTVDALVLADHPNSSAKLHALAIELRSVCANVETIMFDVTDRSDVSRAVGDVSANHGVPNLVFNNAGFQGQFGRVDQLDSADIAQVLQVNVVGVLNVIGEIATRLIAAGTGGSIVNTASMAGVSGAPNMAAYSASKAAVIGLTKSSAKDLAPFNIRVNAVSPAFIGPGAMWDRQVALQAATKSQYYAHEPIAVAEQMIAMVPLRRYGSTTEVANVVAFLLSDAASYLTGVNIEVSGGSS